MSVKKEKPANGKQESLAPAASKLPAEDLKKICDRIARAHGQIGGVLRLIDEGAPCDKIINQMVATSKAIDKAAASLILCGFASCPSVDKAAGKDGQPSPERQQLEKLLLSLV